MMVTQSQIPDILFKAKLDNIKMFHTALKAINNVNMDANIVLTEHGIRFVVEESKYVQAIMYITKDCFSEYLLRSDEQVPICVNLSVINDCLSIFAGVECSLKILYKGESAPLVLILEHHGEDNLITEVSVKTKNAQENLEFELEQDDPSFNQVLLRGADFSNLINEINKGADTLEIYLSPRSPYFRLTALGVIQTDSTIEVAKTSDMFISFCCQMLSTTRYKMSHIRLAIKALSSATKVALRNDKSGLLVLQIVIMTEGDAQIYIEYFITPLLDEFD